MDKKKPVGGVPAAAAANGQDKNNEGGASRVKFAADGKSKAGNLLQVSVNEDTVLDLSTLKYMSLGAVRDQALEVFNLVETRFKVFVSSDPKVRRKDTAKSLKSLLDQLKKVLAQLNLGTFDDKVKNYYLTYNATIYMLDICQFLRKSVYSALCIDYLAYVIISLEANIILTSVKYIEWRIKIYIELMHTYEECGSISAASKTIEMALAKLSDAKALEEADPPLPDYMAKLFANNLRILRALDLKLKLQNQILAVDAWRKKLEELFADDPEGKCIAIVESLRCDNSKMGNTIERKGSSLAWKEAAVQASYEMVKSDIEIVVTTLNQQNEKIIRELEASKRDTFTLSQDERVELKMKNDEFNATLIKEREWKKASARIPLEYHIELIHYAYEVRNDHVFDELTKAALVRTNFRRLEVPFIVDIDIVADYDPNPNIPNGYDRIPVDINEASLRMELRKLRNKNKGSKSNAGGADKKEDDKKDAKKAADKAPAAGKGAAAAQAQPVQVRPNKGVDATPEELQEINHVYVYLVIKRSANPENAIYDMDIIMHDESDERGPYEKIKEGWKAIAIPVRQYTGVQETTHLIPYLLIKHTHESLKEEEQKKTLLTDVRPLFGRNPLIRPDVAFRKIECDIRQVPKEFIRSPNMEYVYLTYKCEDHFFVNERELYIMTNFMSLERTLGNNQIKTLEDEKNVELDIVYDLNKLSELIEVIKSTLIGPLGEQFYEERKDLLCNLAFYLWNKYITSPLYQIEFVYEQRLCEEITDKAYEQYRDIINRARIVYAEALKVFNVIMMRNNEADVLWISKYNIELCRLLEEQEEFKQASQNLRWCLSRILSYRDTMSERGVESQRDKFLPFTITCNNKKIRETVTKMKENYLETKNKLNAQIRYNKRLKQAQNANKKFVDLEKDEKSEEEYESLQAALQYFQDDNTDSIYFKAIENIQGYNETDMIINALHADLLINIFRCELKLGRSYNKAATQKSKDVKSTRQESQYMTKSQAKRIKNIPLNEDYGTLPDKEKIKATIMQSDTARQIKKEYTGLQTALQNAGELDPPKPQMQEYERNLIEEQISNPYSLCLLYMMIAANKLKLPEQKYLLSKAFSYIKETEEMESMHSQNCVNDTIYIFSTLLDNWQTEQNWSQFFPFDHLYKPPYIQKSSKPRKPILISRNSSSITFKLPPFYPSLGEMEMKSNPKKAEILKMSIYGKESANGVDVSAACKDLYNTGLLQKIGSVVTIKHLQQNQKYCFAVGSFDANDEPGNIGETSEDILCLHPLPINLLSSYLAKHAYQMGDFERAEEAADHCISYFTEKSEFVDRYLDYSLNSLYLYRLNQPSIQEVSFIELQALTESFIIKARCLKRIFFADGDVGGTHPKDEKIIALNHQKNILKVCNYLLLAMETSLCIRNYPLAKRLAAEEYNQINELLKMESKTTSIFHVLLKIQILITEIPKQFWDKNLRTLSAKITYEICKLAMQFNEVNLGKRVLYAESKLFNRKWYAVSRLIEITEESEAQQQQMQKDDGKKGAKKEVKKPAKKDDGKKDDPALQQQQQPQQKIIKKLIRELFETQTTVQNYLEEALLSFPEDYGDFVQRFIDRWKEMIEGYLPFVENSPDNKDRMVANLSQHFDYWDCFKDLKSAFVGKVQANFKTNPRYLEICCKLFRRMLEAGFSSNYVNNCIAQVQVDPLNLSDAFNLSKEISALKSKALENNIDWFPASLNYLIIERETNKQGEDTAIELYKQFFQKLDELNAFLHKEEHLEKIGMAYPPSAATPGSAQGQQQAVASQPANAYFVPLYSRFTYLNLWNYEFNFLKALTTFIKQRQNDPDPLKNDTEPKFLPLQESKEITKEIYCNVFLIDKIKMETQIKINKQSTISEEEKAAAKNTEQVFEYLAAATVHAANAKAWLSVQNIAVFTYNFLVSEMTTPFVSAGNKIWIALSTICYCFVDLLQSVKKDGLYAMRENAKQNQQTPLEARGYMQSQENIADRGSSKVQFSETEIESKKWKFFGQSLQQIDLANPNSYYLPKLDEITSSKEFWFDSEKDLNLEVFANVVAFTTEVLMAEEKWNVLIGVTRSFCNESAHFYSKYLLPFTNYAQEILYKEAQQKTAAKRIELIERTKKFEDWKNTKRRKTRTAMMTGEIPQEQVQYEDDKRELEGQINLLEQREKFILGEKNISTSLMDQVGEMNEALKLLQQVRLELRNFGNELKTQNMGKFIEDIFPREEGHRQKNIMKGQHSQFQENFKKILHALQQKPDKIALTLAKKEFGNHKFAQSQTNLSGDDMWKEAVDKIFNSAATLKDFRLQVKEQSKTIAHTIGITQMLVGANIVTNLGYVFYFKQLNQLRDATLLAAEMVFSIFRISLPHPLIAVEYGTYRLREICLNENIFKDPWTLDPTETLLSMERIAWNLIDNDLSLKALPSLCLMDYIATDICYSPFYSVRAKILKSIALANIGSINESYQQLQKVIKEKDLPIKWMKSTQFLQKERGSDWFPEGETFNNSSHPYQEKNREIIEMLAGKEKTDAVPGKGDPKGDPNANKGELLPKNFAAKYGQLNVNLFQYARANLLFAVNENEIFENFDLNFIRNEYLKQSETQLRKLLRKLAFEEELGFVDWQIEKYVYFLQNYIASAKDSTNEQQAQATLAKLKEERHNLFVKREITDKKEEEEYFSNREESLEYVNKREERLSMMARSRFLIHRINQAMNLFTRSYHVLSYGISNLFQYCNEYRYVENGEEAENIELDAIKLQDEAVGGAPAKGGKAPPPKAKDPPPEKKDAKKGGKNDKADATSDQDKLLEEKRRKEEIEKERTEMLKKAEDRKYRRHLSVFWWIKLRTEMCVVLFKQNRFSDCETLIEITRKDCNLVRESFFLSVLDEYTVRLLVKRGKFKEATQKFEETKLFLEKNHLNDTAEYVNFVGDYGELIYERGYHQNALAYFQEAMVVAERMLEDLSYDSKLQNANKKALDDGVFICTELQLPSEIEEEILKKADRLQPNAKAGGAAGAKKDAKKGKDDPKGAKKGDKKGAKVEEIKPDMKVDPLNPIPQYDLMKEVKYTYSNLDIEQQNNTKPVYNSYTKHVALYLRACLRYINCYFTLLSVGSDLDESILELLKKLEIINELSINFIIPISFRIELQYLFALYYKYAFLKEITKIQTEYIKKYAEGKKSSDEDKRQLVKKYRKLATKKPHRDICRNRYFLDVPNYSQQLKEVFIGYLDESSKRLDLALSILGRGECLFLEFNRLSEDIFLETAEICLLKREYKPRIGYKYLDVGELQQKYDQLNKEKQENFVASEIQSLTNNDKIESQKLEMEAQKYLKYAIKASQLKFMLKEFFTEEAKSPLTNVEKLPLDIYFDIIESDYLFKKDYSLNAADGVVLFDESKKKQSVNCVDLLMQLIKLARDSQIFTFTNPHLQNKITKLHRFLKVSFNNYPQKYIIQSIETQPIETGGILVKSIHFREAQEYKFVYMLNSQDKSKIIAPGLDAEAINKIIINEEKEILYGQIYMSESEVDNLLQRSLDLKTNMQESDKKQAAAKERDYKYHKKNFRKLIEDYGAYFFLKDDSLAQQEHNRSSSSSVSRNVQFGRDVEGEETDNLGKFESFIPELTHESIQIFIDLFNFVGLKCVNFNILAIFRYFHHQKYQ